MKKIRTATLKNIYIYTHIFLNKKSKIFVKYVILIFLFHFIFHWYLKRKKKKEKSDSSRVVTVIIDEDMKHTSILISFLAYLYALINTKK